MRLSRILYCCLALIVLPHFTTAQDASSAFLKSEGMQGEWPELRGGEEEYLIHINELAAAGSSYTDEFGEVEDWLELYNFGSSSVDLSELYLSDDPLDPLKWSLSALQGFELNGGDYLLLFADDEPEQGMTHLGFRLNEEGEYLGLFTDDGELIDEINFGPQSAGISYGRLNDGPIWNFFTSPSPGTANGDEGFLGILDSVEFNLSSGFYASPQSVFLEHSDPLASIHYTLDGNEPSLFSTEYVGPFSVDPGTLIRAKAFRVGFIERNSALCTLLEAGDYTLNSILISSNPDGLFGSGGIYANPYNGLEKEAHLSYLVNGETVLEVPAGIRIHAPDNRDQKSFRLYARSEYGENRFDYPFFSQKPIESYKRLILRNAGNDGVEIGHTGLRDPLISTLFGSMGEGRGYSAIEPVNVFINGEYWGVYNLRERQDEYYIEDNYQFSAEEVNLLERTASVPGTYEAILGNWNDYNALENAAILMDLSQDENYEMIADWMNIENYVDYQNTEIYICNQDWLSNNMKFWRTYSSERKWEWLIWDTDWGFGTFYPSYIHGSPDWDALNFALSNWGGWTQDVETELLQNLVENPGFVDYFCTRGADLCNSALRPDNVLEQLDVLKESVEPDIPEQVERWGSSVSTWNYDLGVMSNFILQRKTFFMQHAAERFELGEIHTIRLEVEPAGAGYIEVNTIVADENPWEGQYYEQIPVRVKAVANPGYSFADWTDIGSSAELMVGLQGDSTLVANFIPSIDPGNPVINEIHYHPGGDWACGEWIELYNPETVDIDLTAWVLGNEDGTLCAFEEGDRIPALGYAVVSADSLNFREYYPDVPLLGTELEGNLGDAEGSVYLIDVNQSISDYVNYQSVGVWPTTPNGQGQSLELIEPSLNNNLGSSWFARESSGGTPGSVNEYTVSAVDREGCKFIAYPNPFRERVNIAGSCGFIPGDLIEIYNASGQLQFNTLFNGSGPYAEIQFDSRALPGVYHYRIVRGNSSFTGSLVKLD